MTVSDSIYEVVSLDALCLQQPFPSSSPHFETWYESSTSIRDQKTYTDVVRQVSTIFMHSFYDVGENVSDKIQTCEATTSTFAESLRVTFKLHLKTATSRWVSKNLSLQKQYYGLHISARLTCFLHRVFFCSHEFKIKYKTSKFWTQRKCFQPRASITTAN